MGIRAINWATRQRVGNATAKHALLWLAFHANEKSGECFPSVELLMEEMEVGSKNTVKAALKTLIDAGLIYSKREMRGNRVSRTFYFLNGHRSNIDGSNIDGSNIDGSNIDGSNIDGSNIDDHGSNFDDHGSISDLLMGQPLTPNKEIEQRINKEANSTSMRTSGNSSAIAAVASAQAKMPYPDDFDKSLFDEAEREARSFPEPLPEPPALPPVEQPASTPARPKMAYPPCQYDKVVELYHANCKGLRRVMALTDARKRTINARWREFCKEDDLKTTAEALESFEWYFQEVSKSRFLMGYSTPGPGRDRPFKADFDWLMCPTNFLKVCEGKYSNGPKN
jgi:hypothetical protein